MDSLDNVLEFLGTIPTINDGGCGIAAYSAWKWTEKNLPEELSKIDIVYMYNNEEYRRYKNNQSIIETRKYEEIWTPPHVGLLCDDCILEAGGGEVWEYKLWHIVPIKILEENLKMFWEWNYMFSRFLYIPVIEKALEICLQEFLVPSRQLEN